MTDLSSNTPSNGSSHAQQSPGRTSEAGGRPAPVPPVAGDGNPPRVRKTHKPEILGFINGLSLDVKLEFNTEIESRNRERAKKRWQWHRSPQGDEPVSDDESVITISEDDLDRLSDPIFFDSISTPMPFFIKQEISSRKRRRESDAGVKSSHNPGGSADKRRRVDGSLLENIQPFAGIRDVEGNKPPTSNEASEQGPDKQMTASVTADPEKAKHDNLQATGQDPMNANGFLNGASGFILNNTVMKIKNGAKEKVLQWLAKYTMSKAEFDTSDHVPGCHLGTRITILERLKGQIDDAQHARRMLWLRGPAGVGKSAILQSLAEQLSETSNLGASLFFSRPNGRHNPDFVIPTIAYQLAVRIPPYKEYIKQIMVDNPKVLEKDMERQFQTLIIEPFTKLRLTVEDSGWVILLDGLDECQGENAQALIVNLISRFTHQHPTAPLVWVIASRPEAHLQVVFNSEGVRDSFEEHEVLANSDDACRDVEKFLRAKFGEIRENYKDLIPTDGPWPVERDITRVSTTSSGLFALAVTIVHYVDDPDACDPISQLATVLSRTEGLEPGSLSTLYTLYSTILAGVPKSLLPILKLVLSFYATEDEGDLSDDTTFDLHPLVIFATIFGLQQHTVYAALRKLHSVIKVPPLGESGRLGIKFYHASFPDYLKTLGDHTISVDMARKYWWGLLTFLHWGDSTSYGNAIYGGYPPVPLSWDVKLADGILEHLRRTGIPRLLHLLLPQCLAPGGCLFGHPWLFSDAKEQQNAFKRIDFSALIFRYQDSDDTLDVLYDLFKWLVNAVPPELSQSDVVKKFCMRDLDIACVSKAKFNYRAFWFYAQDKEETLSSASSRAYATQSLLSTDPIEEISSELGKLQSENVMMDVLVVGERPSKRCVLIRTEPTNVGGEGQFYYIPYCG